MSRKIIIALVLASLLVVVAAQAGWFGRSKAGLTASGTLEARNITVGSKVGGRVSQVLVAEGDRVQPGQVLLTFDVPEVEARMMQAQGTRDEARANYAKMQHGSRPEEIAEARAASGEGNNPGFRVHEMEQAQAALQRAESDAVNAERNYKRYSQLFADGVVSRQLRDDAETQSQMAKAQVESARHAVASAEGQLRAARAVQQRTEHGFRPEDIEAARAAVVRAEGTLKEAQANWAERELKSPAAAVVEVLDIRPGDLIPANSGIVKLLEADQLYVVVYVPESEIGKVHIGQAADVTVDAFKQPFRGRVEQIRQKAEFLPRNVQTKSEREHQVVGVKLRVENPDNKLRAGVNADVRFLEGQ